MLQQRSLGGGAHTLTHHGFLVSLPEEKNVCHVLAGAQWPRLLPPVILLGGRATYELDNSPSFVVVIVVLVQTVWVGENMAPAEAVGFLQRVYNIDPAPSLAPTVLSLRAPRSRYAKRLQHFPIVLLARRASWKPLNTSPGLSLAKLPVRRC